VTIEKPTILAVAGDAGLSDLDPLIKYLPDDIRRETNSYIFRLSSALLHTLFRVQAKPHLEAIQRRSEGKPVFFISLDDTLTEIDLYGLHEGTLTPILPEKGQLAEIGMRDLTSLLYRHTDLCVSNFSPRFHFVTPSLKHTDYFLRVANIIDSAEALDTLAFWLLPKISTADTVVLDTWTISAIALRCNQLLSKQVRKKDLPYIDAFSTHPQASPDQALDVLKAANRRTDENGTILLVISVLGSGRIVELIKELYDQVQGPKARLEICSIYSFLERDTFDTLCNLSEKPQAYGADSCDLCKSSNKPIAVHPSLLYANGTENQALLGTRFMQDDPDVKTCLEFMSRFEHVRKAFSLHSEDPNDHRHHAFYIDVHTLLTDELFKNDFINKLNDLNKHPDLIVTPEHRAGRSLGDIAAKHLGVGVVARNNFSNLDAESNIDAEILKSKDLLIIDDVLMSGSRLSSYNDEARKQLKLDSIAFMVGIARCPGRKQLKTLRSSLIVPKSESKQFLAVHTVFLPLWGNADCPWCDEDIFLSRIAGNLSDPPSWILELIKRLRNPETLREMPLLQFPSLVLPVLGQESLFGPEGTTADILIFRLAMVVQVLRGVEEEPLDPDFPICGTFRIKNFEWYTEALIRSVLLRVVRPIEWGRTHQLELSSFLAQEAVKPGQELLLAEVLLAIKRKVIAPPLAIALFDQIKESLKGHLNGFLEIGEVSDFRLW
jgi:hypothetical protein